MVKSSEHNPVRLYTYSGPVLEFDRCITSMWSAETMATSKQKARSNLMFQFKKMHNKTASTKITLPGEIVAVE